MTRSPDERISFLYGLPLSEFTPQRNALGALLRSEGAEALALEVKSLRKPTAAAWSVNQLVRAEPDRLEALLGAGGELRQAHRQAASGRGAAQLRAATEAERIAVESLMSRAPSVLGRTPSAALAESMRNTLHAASSDDDARALVAAGMLTTELRPVGLGPEPGRARAGKARDRGASQLDREREQLVRAVERAEASYARAREVADEAAARAREAEARLVEARSKLAAIKRRHSKG